MNKYLSIVNASWQRALTYRFTVLSYRVGEIGEIIVLILMWSAIYAGQSTISGMTLQEMITYILVGNFITAVVRNFLSGVVARDIKDGKLSMFLVKPMGYLNYILANEIGRISVATMMSVVTSGLIILAFGRTFLWNDDPRYLGIVLLMLALAFCTELLLSFLIGLIAFWTDEVDGVYTTIDRVKKFFSGGYFPLTLLPTAFVHVSLALPFAYSFFVPAQLYLRKVDIFTGLRGIGVQLLWIVILAGLIHVVWQRGLRKYEGVGI